MDEVSGSKTEKSFLMEKGFCSNSKTEIKGKEQESVGAWVNGIHWWINYSQNVRAIKRVVKRNLEFILSTCLVSVKKHDGNTMKTKTKIMNVSLVWFVVRSRKNINHKSISFA